MYRRKCVAISKETIIYNNVVAFNATFYYVQRDIPLYVCRRALWNTSYTKKKKNLINEIKKNNNNKMHYPESLLGL